MFKKMIEAFAGSKEELKTAEKIVITPVELSKPTAAELFDMAVDVAYRDKIERLIIDGLRDLVDPNGVNKARHAFQDEICDPILLESLQDKYPMLELCVLNEKVCNRTSGIHLSETNISRAMADIWMKENA